MQSLTWCNTVYNCWRWHVLVVDTQGAWSLWLKKAEDVSE